MKELRSENKPHTKGRTLHGNLGHDGDPTARVGIRQLPGRAGDKYLAHTEMTDSLDAEFGRVLDAAATDDHD